MKNKKWLLVLIVIFPSMFWVILETSTINSHRLPYYGPKTVSDNGDTTYYEVNAGFSMLKKGDTSLTSIPTIDRNDFPVFAMMFIKDQYINDSYRIAGLWEFLQYKFEKVQHIPFFLVTEAHAPYSETQKNLEKLNEYKNVKFLTISSEKFDSINKIYFKEKPVYIDHSFFVLVDAKRHVRGYYDARYAPEIKRLTDEYKHLRLKEEKEKLIKDNEIKQNS